jgi:hypothetical protein
MLYKELKVNTKKLLCKFAVLVLGLTALQMTVTHAKAAGPFCQMMFCDTGSSMGHCGYEYGEDCSLCYGDDGSISGCNSN